MLSFFFNDPATTEIYTLSLHDALPIFCRAVERSHRRLPHAAPRLRPAHVGHQRRRPIGAAVLLEDRTPHVLGGAQHPRSEEHTSELQSRQYLVCRLLLEKKKTTRFTF